MSAGAAGALGDLGVIVGISLLETVAIELDAIHGAEVNEIEFAALVDAEVARRVASAA